MRKMNETETHHPNAADIFTAFRMAGTLVLAFLQPFSPEFFWVYALAGLTDVLDGWIARKTKTASDFGAKLDSIADLLFYTMILFQIFPSLCSTLPAGIWYAVTVIVMIRVSAYLLAAVKYRQFVSLHTYLNKLTGIAVFMVPFLFMTPYAIGYCWAVCAVAVAAALEELTIHLLRQTYHPNIKSVFQDKN